MELSGLLLPAGGGLGDHPHQRTGSSDQPGDGTVSPEVPAVHVSGLCGSSFRVLCRFGLNWCTSGFCRQILLIGGSNPIEDVEKFKDQGYVNGA